MDDSIKNNPVHVRLQGKYEWYGLVDRSGWPEGPWDGEPDKMQWVHAGLDCLALRGPVGSWNGYVGVPETHPQFGASIDDMDVGVHGGLTYGNKQVARPTLEECADTGIDFCEVLSVHKKTYVLGFDCAHSGDLCPYMLRYQRGIPGEVYRDLAYVTREIESLAEQLAAAGG